MATKMKLALISIPLICHLIAMADADQISVLDFGAKADGVTDDTKAFSDAWAAACSASGDVTVTVPFGDYFLTPLEFKGPCNNVQSLTYQLQGTLKATTDLTAFKTDTWIKFEKVTGLHLTGGGTVDGLGATSWPFSTCLKNQTCQRLPISLKFVGTKNTIVEGITSMNSKSYHMALVNCNKFDIKSIVIQAPEDSPKTDGIHIERSTGVTIVSSTISTGGGGVTIGHGTFDVTVSDVHFCLGDGITIGSLGKSAQEKNVENIYVRDCTFADTTNGVCIKTFADSDVPTHASNLIFENFVMSNVGHPIMIDQEFCPGKSCDASKSSRVQLRDMIFSNIRGTASMHDAVALKCSRDFPCENVTINYIDLQTFDSQKTIETICSNVRPVFSGDMNPPACAV